MSKRLAVSALIVIVFSALGAVGCREVKPEATVLNAWLEEVAFKKIIDKLKSDSHMKGLPFIIVKVKGEEISNTIDGLTVDVRDRLVTALLEHPETRLVRRHPVSSSFSERPYALQELSCARFVEPQMLLTIDIRKTGAPDSGTAVINIRAIDLETGQWMPLSLHQDVSLSAAQRASLESVGPDEYLRGLKYVPFEEAQKDEMAAYLAYNLSCIFQQGYSGEDVVVFFDDSKMREEFSDIAWVIRKRLNFCSEIRLARDKEEADWVIEVEARVMDPGKGLWQVWVDVWEQEGGGWVKGLATYAYFLSNRRDMSGSWWIYDIGSKELAGRLIVKAHTQGGYCGDLFGPDGELRAQGIIVSIGDQNVSWTHYDRKLNRTFKTSGVIQKEAGRAKMIVSVRSFPPSDRLIEQELLPFRLEE